MESLEEDRFPQKEQVDKVTGRSRLGMFEKETNVAKTG